MPATRTCSECAASISGTDARRKTCSNRCRMRRSIRLRLEKAAQTA